MFNQFPYLYSFPLLSMDMDYTCISNFASTALLTALNPIPHVLAMGLTGCFEFANYVVERTMSQQLSKY
jgi:hypothetical protein